jgi:hypothetical protein
VVRYLQFMPCFLTRSLSLLDVIGIVKEVGPIGEITSKASNRTVSQFIIHVGHLKILHLNEDSET